MTYTLYDIVAGVCGGGIIPEGETIHDGKAYRRMGEIENLLDNLIDDMLVVADVNGNEASVSVARSEARRWIKGKVMDIVDDRCACADEKRWLLELADDIKQRLDDWEE